MIEEGKEVLKKKNVDLVLLDIQLDGAMTGIDLARIIDQEFGIPFIYLTSFADEDTLDKAAETFPASYLVKPFKEHDLAPAVKMALASKRGNRVQRLPSLQIINHAQVAQLTPAEYTILTEVWRGKTNVEIAEVRFVSKNTVKTHVRNIYSKLGVHSKSEVLRYLRELK